MSTVSTVNSSCDNEAMNEEKQKREIIRLMRDERVALYDAAECIGVSKDRARGWTVFDGEFHRVVTAIRLARYLDTILRADDLVRSGKKLSKAEKSYVEIAVWLRDFIAFIHPDEVGFISPEMAERGRKAMKNLE